VLPLVNQSDTVESDFTNGVPSIQMNIGADTVGIRSERPFGVRG